MEYDNEYWKSRRLYYYLINLGLWEAADIVYETVKKSLFDLGIEDGEV